MPTGRSDGRRGSRSRPNRAQRFAFVGLLVTLVDVVVLVALIRDAGMEPFTADLISVGVATVVSLVLHRLVTLAESPFRRWFEEQAGAYLAGLAGSLAVDVVVFTSFTHALDVHSVHGLVIAKTVSLAAAVLVRVTSYRSALGAAVRSDHEQPTTNVDLVDASKPRLSVVVPAFREADRIADSVRVIRAELEPKLGEKDLEIVVVDDGSGDATAARARAAGADVVVQLDENRGKGAAVREGMLAATGGTRAFLDADLAYSPGQVLPMLERCESGWEVVVGSRKHEATTTLVASGRLRQLGSRVVNVITSVVLLGRYRDTQCGVKAFRADAAEEIFTSARVDRFAADIEMLYIAERKRMSLTEVPVTVSNSERSTVRVVRDTLRLFRDVARIRLWGRSGFYDDRVVAVEPAASDRGGSASASVATSSDGTSGPEPAEVPGR